MNQLKKLFIETELVKDGAPGAVIIAPKSGRYDQLARSIQDAILEFTGVALPIVNDDSSDVALPFKTHVILLGNRSSHRLVNELYDRYYHMVDLWYPGAGGYALKSLHNPFGNGLNAILVGASDDAGMKACCEAFIGRLRICPLESREKEYVRSNCLTIGWLSEIRLGQGVNLPTDIKQIKTWEERRRDDLYFGWNSLSRRMALYYMTGDEFHAREFLRLTFPDEQARKEIGAVDEERIENKDDPVAGPYHYNAHLMILLWDLIEESPIFTDDQRLRITQSFWRQMMKPGGYVPDGVYGLTQPPESVGSRHHQFAALSLYCLARYFDTYYPSNDARRMLESAQYFFAPLHRQSTVKGEGCSLFWYSTSIEATLWYVILSGDKIPMENGVIRKLLCQYEVLISGRIPDWALREASLSLLHKAAYLTQDERWIHYRNRTELDAKVFRVGQSFYPAPGLPATSSHDLAGKWSVWYSGNPSSETGRDQRSYWAASYRSAWDASGDFILMVGDYDFGRTPYYSLAVIELRMNGHTILQGYRNQVFSTNNGLANPSLSKNAILRKAVAFDGVALASNEVACAGYCRWRRTLAQKTKSYLVVVDELTAPEDTMHADIQVQWEVFGKWLDESKDGVLRVKTGQLPDGIKIPGFANDPIQFPEEPRAFFEIRFADAVSGKLDGNLAAWQLQTVMKKNIAARYFSLIAPVPDAPHQSLACFRIHENAAVIALPMPGIVVAGNYAETHAEFAVLADDHLYGLGVLQAGLSQRLLEADKPIDCYWDYEARRIAVVAETHAMLRLKILPEHSLVLDGLPLARKPDKNGMTTLDIDAGQHTLEGVTPDSSLRQDLESRCRAAPGQTTAETHHKQVSLPSPRTLFSININAPISDMIVFGVGNETRIAVAAGNNIHVHQPDGIEARTLCTEHAIDRLCWWKEHELLLAGCRDDQVIAFDDQGKRKWSFLSREDPAVFKAAKQYWFRSAPGHGGIHGLHTGIFLNGESQAFVGSAGTLEIINEKGELIKRMPVFWGPGSIFSIIERIDGALHLLIAREPADSHGLAIVDNQSIKHVGGGLGGYAFSEVPIGHTPDCGGFASTIRHHIFYDDINGDGAKELISDVNGRLCRVTVWDTRGYNNNSFDGQPLYNAQFGPVNPHCGNIALSNRKNRGIRDMDIGDIDGDGKKEIIVALSNGKVMALNCQCELLWSSTLQNPPMVLKAVGTGATTPVIAVGCENGDLVLLNNAGAVTHEDKVRGTPVGLQQFTTNRTQVMVFATNQGHLKAVTA